MRWIVVAALVAGCGGGSGPEGGGVLDGDQALTRCGTPDDLYACPEGWGWYLQDEGGGEMDGECITVASAEDGGASVVVAPEKSDTVLLCSWRDAVLEYESIRSLDQRDQRTRIWEDGDLSTDGCQIDNARHGISLDRFGSRARCFNEGDVIWERPWHGEPIDDMPTCAPCPLM